MTLPAPADVPVRRVDWPAAVRIVSSRYPPVGAFDRVASAAELESLFALEGLTNERLRAELGELSLVAPEDRLFGEGTTPIMAAFTHPSPTRFSDGSHGVLYCAREARTAIRETRFHRGRFLELGRFPAMDLEMREYHLTVSADCHDLRGRAAEWSALYDPDDYAPGQAFGAALRREGSWGVVYDSVRDADGGECTGVLRPPAVIPPCVQSRHLVYRWDGTSITDVFAVTRVE